MTTTLENVEWAECLLEPTIDRELEREVRRAAGIVHPMVRLLAPCPWLARAVGLASFRSGMLAHIDYELAELIFLAVSRDSSCRYCYAAQRSLLRIVGFDEDRIRRLEEASDTAEADPRERLVLDFARRVSRSNPAPSAADREALRDAGYGEAAIGEIAYAAAHTVAGNRFTMLPALPLDVADELERRWLTRLLRPFVARMIRSRSRRGEPERLPASLRTGPFSYVTLELDGSPTARLWQLVTSWAFASPILTTRAKALVFAVVARGLGSARAEREARQLLAEEGLDTHQVDEILDHLGSPVLDEVESLVVPFARETIRVRPADVQRRARKLRDRTTPEQFLEAVGIVGIANATCRLSLVLCES